MSSTATWNLCMLLLSLWIVSVLTSSVKNGLKTDVLAQSVTKISNGSSTITSETVVSSTPEVHEPRNVTNVNTATHGSLFMGEGGPVSISTTTTQQLPSNNSVSRNASDTLTSEERGSNNPGRNNTASKIVARKGADLNDTASVDKTLLSNATKSESTHTNQQETTEATIVKHANNTEDVAPSNVNTTQETTAGSSRVKTSTTVRTHKPKPTATIAGSDVDRPMPVSSKTSPFGMPRKIDYIVPVIITIVALPLMGAATYIVYRRGRDCWDKRHYRRMDFLIDGMYND